MSIEKPSFTISTLQEVTREVSFKPIVGFEKTNDLPDGWQFDIKRWATVFDRKLPTLPRLSNPSYQGLNVEEYFKSGVSNTSINDFNLLSIDQEELNYKTSWLPKLRSGSYFRFNEEFEFFSDDSVVQYVDDSDNESNRNVLLLSSQPNIDSDISATIYKRDKITKFPRKYMNIHWVGEFSGIYSGGEEQETLDSLGTVNWSNIDTTKKEFILDSSYAGKYYLRFNDDYTFQVGRVISSYDEIGVCEKIGTATGEDNQVFYTKYFPIVSDDIHLYVANESTYIEWTQVDSFFELTNSISSKEFYVDKDFGAIYFGSGSNAPADGMHIMITYSVTVRVEYEPESSDKKITAFNSDLNPVNQSQNQGFVCITHDKPDAANISLVIDKSIVAGSSPTEYGPIYAGSDFAILRAEVTSISDIAVPKTNVTFSMSPYLGALSGSDEITVVTNGSGNSFSSYQPPVNANNLGFYSRTIRSSNHPSYLLTHTDVIIHDEEASLLNKEEEIFIYQILKDDLFLGYDDIDSYIISEITPPSWVNTPLNPLEATFIRWKEELVLEYGWKEWESPGAIIDDDGEDVSGRKVIIYQISSVDNVDANAIDPADGSTGLVVVPVKPVLVEKITDVSDTHYGKWRAIYLNGAISSITGDVAGYWLGTSRTVKFKASCWSSYYNKTIESNEIIARISPPSYMLGEYLFNGDKVPYGWKLPDEFNNIAAAINGITFITINPRVTPYQIAEIIDSGLSDDYASNQFNTKSFSFEIV